MHRKVFDVVVLGVNVAVFRHVTQDVPGIDSLVERYTSHQPVDISQRCKVAVGHIESVEVGIGRAHRGPTV